MIAVEKTGPFALTKSFEAGRDGIVESAAITSDGSVNTAYNKLSF
jgi:hypothetical protein